MADRTQRLRDPIHGLVVFDEKDDGDMLAWRLIQTQEFQRLRRIKQLGVSEFVFPGATHSRFAHSIGVYHNARKLKLGLDPENPLVRFLANADSLNDYRRLDDAVVWGAIEAMTRCGDARTSDLANRLWKRVRPYVLDLTAEFGQNDEARLNAERRLDRSCESSLNAHVFKDTAPLSLYSSAGGDEDKAHKMVRIRMGDGTHREITEFEDTIISKTLMKKSVMTRFYFLDANEKDKAAQRMRGR